MVKGISRDWKTKTHVITSPDWDPDEHVIAKAYYGSRDREQVLSAAVEQVRTEEGTTVTRATLDRFKTVRRQLAVQSWTLKYEDGSPMPCEPEIVAQLPPEVADVIDAAIEALWEGVGGPQTAEEAQQEREDRATFQRAQSAADEGRAAGGGAHDGARAPDLGPNGTAPAHPPAVARLQPGVVGAEQHPSANP